MDTPHHSYDDDDANDFHHRETLPAPADYSEETVARSRDEEAPV